MRTVEVFIEIIKSVLNHDKSITIPSDINWDGVYNTIFSLNRPI